MLRPPVPEAARVLGLGGAEIVFVKVIGAVSEELFGRQPEAYRNSVLPVEARQDLMFVSSGARRMRPLRNVGSLADAYSLTADWDNQWLTGGLEADVIAKAHLDADSIFAGRASRPCIDLWTF